jgi:thiol-disulfide isomerase/thioredoxin
MKKISSYESFVDFIQNGVKAAYFSTPTCGVCHSWKPRVAEMMEELNMECAHIDLTEVPKISGQFLVMGVPTLLVFHEHKEVYRFGAYDRLDQIRGKLERIQNA